MSSFSASALPFWLIACQQPSAANGLVRVATPVFMAITARPSEDVEAMLEPGLVAKGETLLSKATLPKLRAAMAVAVSRLRHSTWRGSHRLAARCA